MVGAVTNRWTVALRDAVSIPAQNKYLHGLQVDVPGLAVCVYNFSMFVNAPTILKLFTVYGNVLKIKKIFSEFRTRHAMKRGPWRSDEQSVYGKR